MTATIDGASSSFGNLSETVWVQLEMTDNSIDKNKIRFFCVFIEKKLKSK
jgi:hypothetical protein